MEETVRRTEIIQGVAWAMACAEFATRFRIAKCAYVWQRFPSNQLNPQLLFAPCFWKTRNWLQQAAILSGCYLYLSVKGKNNLLIFMEFQ